MHPPTPAPRGRGEIGDLRAEEHGGGRGVAVALALRVAHEVTAVAEVRGAQVAEATGRQARTRTPDQATARMTLPEGFTVTQFAAEPAVVQPFAFCFDDRGSVWVCENLNYATR